MKTKGEAPAKAPMNVRKDIPQLLQELDQNARTLDKAGTSASKIISLKKGKTAGEFYGVLHKGINIRKPYVCVCVMSSLEIIIVNL